LSFEEIQLDTRFSCFRTVARRDRSLQSDRETSQHSGQLEGRIMRSVLMLSVGVGVVVGLLIRLFKGKAAGEDVGAVSGQWIAEQSVRSDQTWP
jgi:hypothetical protein